MQTFFANLFILIFSALVFSGSSIRFSVNLESGKPVIYQSTSENNLLSIHEPAVMNYQNESQHKSHFATLQIITNSQYNDTDQAYYAGYLEGYGTANGIYDFHQNSLCSINCSWIPPKNLTDFINEQNSWVNAQIKKFPNDGFWQYIQTLQSQLQGIRDGYNNSDFGQQHPLTTWDFQFIEVLFDLNDIYSSLIPSAQTNFSEMKTMDQVIQALGKGDHCTSLVKIADDFSDILVGHSTWDQYSSMNRIFKQYEFNFQNELVAAKKIQFSSYPGFTSSGDDYFLTDQELVIMETTNGFVNNSIYSLINPHALYSWQSVRVATALAANGQQWFQYAQIWNSGTYANQYQILDYKLFTPGNALLNNTLWIVELQPGLAVGADMTYHLNREYWPSYNVPFFKEIYDVSGYASLDAQFGLLEDTIYQSINRARISRREEIKVNDVESLKYFLRYNEYKTDPYSYGDPYFTICARGDLRGTDFFQGCTDTKLTSYKLASQMQSWIISGPTTQDQPPFQWLPEYNVSHLGQPDTFNFEFELIDFSTQE